jgi:DNA-binding Xre family transcriptional regulator
MAVSYAKLWKLLIDKKMSKADLRKVTGISSNTLTKMNKGEDVAMSVLDKICKQLECDYGDIITHIPNVDDGGNKDE